MQDARIFFHIGKVQTTEPESHGIVSDTLIVEDYW